MSAIRVLIADDHRIVREGLKSLLAGEEDITVIGEAGNGREAVKMVNDARPDVVVMDISMEELNGIEATRQIVKGWPECRVIILSMHATSEYIHQAFEAGATGYLLKESAGQEVARAVRDTARGKRYLARKVAEVIEEGGIKGGEVVRKKGPLGSLSPREREIVQLVVEGKSSAEIASALFISAKTVETYRSRLMKKLGTENVPALVKFAIKHGITEA